MKKLSEKSKLITYITTSLICLAAIILATAVIYLAYYLITCYRVGDTELDIREAAAVTSEGAVPLDTPLSATTFNIGFGAYNDEFSFFMDGGESSRAKDRETVLENIKGVTDRLSHVPSDIILLQEVDVKGTRSHGVDEAEVILDTQPQKYSTFAVNYDSPYLIYPFTSPHGKNKSGLLTMTTHEIESARRVELPIEGFPKNLVDLDRCYSKQVLATTDPHKKLVVYNLHLSAYSSDGEITNTQLKGLLSDMQGEYDCGNYIIAGGDFNRDLLGDSSEYFNRQSKEATWAKPFPTDFLSDDFTLCAPSNAPSCRDADTAYDPESTFVLSVDGFIVSRNVEASSCETDDMRFAFSDHNPVRLEFRLIK